MSWPRVLGIVAPPEDDVWSYSDHRKDRVWQELERIALNRGVKVRVKEFPHDAHALGKCIHYQQRCLLLINCKVPNWYKPRVLAHELAHYKLHRYMDSDAYWNNPEYRMAIEQEADRFADRLIRLIKQWKFPSPKIDYKEKREKERAEHDALIEKASKRINYLMKNPGETTPEEVPIIEKMLRISDEIRQDIKARVFQNVA